MLNSDSSLENAQYALLRVRHILQAAEGRLLTREEYEAVGHYNEMAAQTEDEALKDSYQAQLESAVLAKPDNTPERRILEALLKDYAMRCGRAIPELVQQAAAVRADSSAGNHAVKF